MTKEKLLGAVGVVVVLTVGAYVVLSPYAERAQQNRLADVGGDTTDIFPIVADTREGDVPAVEEQSGEVKATEPKNAPAPVSILKPVSTPAPTTPTSQSKTPPTPTPVLAPTPAPTPAPAPSGYTAADVALHNSQTSCWTTVNGSVYDITSYISRHPGGVKNIMKICGKDGTSLFEGQHGGDSKPENMLAKLRIGDLNE